MTTGKLMLRLFMTLSGLRTFPLYLSVQLYAIVLMYSFTLILG